MWEPIAGYSRTVRVVERVLVSGTTATHGKGEVVCPGDDWEGVSRVHGRMFGEVRPANTLLEIGRLVGDYAVEIEAEAVVDR